MDRRRVLKKCGVRVDRISPLPDVAIVRILSSLPLNTAASTSILSRRWSHLWKHTPKLIFQNNELSRLYDSQKKLEYVNWVNSVLGSHKAPSLQELTVDFEATKSNRNDVAKWLEFAFSRRVERLEYNWHCLYLFDDALLLEEIITLPSSAGIIRSLKVLCLKETKTSADAIHFFLGNCPNLEQLVIVHAIITSDLELVSPSLKHLEIRPHNRNISIRVSTPSLTFLKIDNDTRKHFLENVPKLVHVIFCCRFDSTLHDFGTAASQLETLTISMDRPKASFSVPEMPKLKKLVIDDRYHLQLGITVPFSVTSFLRASPCLEEFEVKITGLTFEEGVSEVPKVGPVFKHLSLERFKSLWFCGKQPCEDRINLVRYVVDSCVALEEIYISQCDGKQLGAQHYVVVDCCVRVATPVERATFESTIQLQIPAHIKLRMGNHYHESPYNSTKTICPHI